MTGQFPGGQSHGPDTESGWVGEISNMFDILLIKQGQAGKLQPILIDSLIIAPDPKKMPSYRQVGPSGTSPQRSKLSQKKAFPFTILSLSFRETSAKSLRFIGNFHFKVICLEKQEIGQK